MLMAALVSAVMPQQAAHGSSRTSPRKGHYLSAGARLQLHQSWAAPRSCLGGPPRGPDLPAREQVMRSPWR